MARSKLNISDSELDNELDLYTEFIRSVIWMLNDKERLYKELFGREWKEMRAKPK